MENSLSITTPTPLHQQQQHDTTLSSSPLALLSDIPDEILYKIISYVATSTNRATIICHVLAPLCKPLYHKLIVQSQDNISSSSIWDILLIEDYGSINNSNNINSCSDQYKISNIVHHSQQPTRRVCKRLCRTSIHRVRDVHMLMKSNTEIAFFYLSEMVNCTQNHNKLSKTRLVRLINEYGPNLQMNHVTSTGGLFLVEICRAKHIKENVILKCVQLLMEEYHVLPNLRTAESNISYQTPLCVVAARGLHTIVQYLLQHPTIDINIISSGRFALYSKPKKIIRCEHCTALQFAITMRDAERIEGANENSLLGLNKCIQLLEQAHTQQKAPTSIKNDTK